MNAYFFMSGFLLAAVDFLSSEPSATPALAVEQSYAAPRGLDHKRRGAAEAAPLTDMRQRLASFAAPAATGGHADHQHHHGSGRDQQPQRRVRIASAPRTRDRVARDRSAGPVLVRDQRLIGPARPGQLRLQLRAVAGSRVRPWPRRCDVGELGEERDVVLVDPVAEWNV